MLGSFRHKGLEEIHFADTTRRIGNAHLRKCVRGLQLLDVAAQPDLGGHLKTGQSGTLQNRPVERIQDSISFTSPATVSATVFR
jgi:hypothetical protein